MHKSALKHLPKLSSLKLSFAGMAALLAGVLASYFNQDQPVIWIAVPLLILAVNLLAAIVFNPRVRQNSGLIMFHLCLLTLALLAALGQMTSMQGRVEIAQGAVFDSAAVTITRKGPWHSLSDLRKIKFQQGDIQVEYAPGLSRGMTKSQLLINNEYITIGDNLGYKKSGYRFYTTSNKGYAAILAWYGEDQPVIHGAVNFPSFPLYDWKQENQWSTPTGQLLNLKFISDISADNNNNWQLNSQAARGQLIIEQANGIQKTLRSGQRIQLDGGQLEFIEVRMWMGYGIFYNPWLSWFFAASFVGVLGLAWHFYLNLFAVGGARLRGERLERNERVVPVA